MTEDDADRMDRNRRHFLTVAAAVTGAVGAGFVAVPFLSSLKPSARAQALGAPVEVPLGSIAAGEMVRVLWRGKLVFVLRRSDSMLGTLGKHDDKLRDPDSVVAEQQPEYAANAFRSRHTPAAARRPASSGHAACRCACPAYPACCRCGAARIPACLATARAPSRRPLSIPAGPRRGHPTPAPGRSA